MDIRLDPKMAVLFGRTKEINFPLAKNTYVPDVVGESEWVIIRKSNCWGNGDEVRFQKLSLELWNDVYVRFDSKLPEKIYSMHLDGSIFSAANQLQMLDEIIAADRELGGAKLKIMELLKSSHPVCAVFAINDDRKLKNLIPAQVYWRFWGAEWHDIALCNLRAYYGEKIAFYFAFLQYYTMSLILPCIIGTVFFIVQQIEGKINCNGIWIWLIFLILWNVIFCNFWRGYEKRLRKKWGMERYSHKAIPRPEFKGKRAFNEVSGLLQDFELKGKCRKQFISYSAVLFWAFLVVLAIYWLLMAKQFSKHKGWEIFIAGANALQIQVYNLIYT